MFAIREHSTYRRSRRSIMFGTANTLTLSTIDTSRYLDRIRKSTIGVDDLFQHIEQTYYSNGNYPPYNVIKETETSYILEAALAGFREDEISVYTEGNELFIKSKKESSDEKEYVYKGLAQREFSRSWRMSDDVEVSEVKFENGLLIVRLNKIIPESHRRKDWM